MTQLPPNKSSDTIGPLQTALFKIFKALARLVLGFGLSYERFDELARQAFVAVAEEDFVLPGRKQTNARVAVVTGLSRKEVTRLRGLKTHSEELTGPVQYNRAARVLNGWLRDTAYQNSDKQPAILPLEGEAGSFSRLAKDYSGDIPVRAVLDELLHTGAVERLKNGNLQVAQQAYIPEGNIGDKLVIFGTDVAALVDTINHNLNNPPEKSYLHTKVAYNNLPAEALPVLRKISAEEGLATLKQLNRWFAAQDRDANPEAIGTDRYYAGVSIYFYNRKVKGPENN
ncbi:DUF6502 family protein [Candidatus Halobeggiatoa sp. HSG11]|nr:DUF6502 family protein [Candidatus Halobeggiatoa sp. HSG11]